MFAAPALGDALGDFVRFTPYDGLQLTVTDEPVLAARSFAGLGVALIADAGCAECYTLTSDGRAIVVRGGAPLGLQYGLAALLEAWGLRFFHPFATHVPERLRAGAEVALLGARAEPETARRGLHLHTLHPIEGLYDFWAGEPDSVTRARRTIDWLVKNRGNTLQWVALDDIVREPGRLGPWRDQTAAILAAAHRRGVACGLGIQLFGRSNLQQAFDLVDLPDEPLAPQIAERLALVTDGLAFDHYNLSFGEFSAADPEDFIGAVNLVSTTLESQAPAAELSAVIHVGDDVRVTYRDQELIYYFLVQFADPRIEPWVHTVMYYNLFDDAGGAYHHDAFDEHRAFLLARLAAGEPVGYFPESAYWIAFDNSVPTTLPVYVQSRHRDLAELRAAGARLDSHVLFSSGWEWGYWQTDYATLRMNWALPATIDEVYGEMFAPYPRGDRIAALLAEVARVQYRALIGERLAPWLAGRDVLMDLGDLLGIVSQPRRPLVEEIAALDPAGRAALRAAALDPLETFAAELEAFAARGERLDQRSADPFVAELADGLRVTAGRARFVTLWLRALLDGLDGGDATGRLADAEALLAAAEQVVARRHRRLHDPLAERLLTRQANPTVYQYGYLLRADELCFWHRELAQVLNQLFAAGRFVRGCDL